MSESEPRKISISITDRLNETRQVELNINRNLDGKKFNTELLEKLKQFQQQANSLMTEFVEKEKSMLSEKKLSNDHLKNLKKPVEKDEDSSDEDSGDDDEEETSLGGEDNDKPELKRSKEDVSVSCEPLEKKKCVENS